MHYSEEQQQAIDLCCDQSKRLVGVTGEAGTGKTTILRAAYETIIDKGILRENICLCAPTGRAAKRIQEATGIRAVTIHRMMRYSMPDDEDDISLPAHDKNNPLPYSWIFVDEASMISEELYRAVIDAMPTGSVIRFFGDVNQLPPVQGLSPFKGVLEKWPSATLTHNFRSDDGIVAAARNILQGRAPQPNDKFTMLNPGTGNLLVAMDEFINDTYRGLTSQIIIPTKKGKYGTFAVNRYMQQRLNNKSRSIRLIYETPEGDSEERIFRVGDKVIWTKNDYIMKLFNGMIGWIVDINDDTGDIIVNFEDRDVVVPPLQSQYDAKRGREIFKYDPRQYLDLAYAITTHKAQGSEFSTVLLLLNRSFVLNRANFYTAVTRAKNNVICLLGPGGLSAAMQKGRT